MAYNAASLEGSATFLKVKAVGVVFGYAFCGVIFVTILHQFALAIQNFETLISLGHIKFNPAMNQLQLEASQFFWILIGGFFGLLRAQKLMLEANKLLWMVEQEKHLRHLASVATTWTQAQTPRSWIP